MFKQSKTGLWVPAEPKIIGRSGFFNAFENFGSGGIAPSAAGGGGGGGAAESWAEVWADMGHIYDLEAANITTSGTDLVTAVSTGSVAAIFKATVANLAYSAEDADFNNLPSVTLSGSNYLLARNTGDTANLRMDNFFAATTGIGFFTVLAKISTSTGATATEAASLPGILGDGADGSYAFSYAGADQVIKVRNFDGSIDATTGAYTRDSVALLTIVKNATHVQYWRNATMVAEVASGDPFGLTGAVYLGRSYGNVKVAGKFGPWAFNSTVPADLSDRLTAAMATAGIS